MKSIDIATVQDIEEINNIISKVNADKTHPHSYCALSLDDFEDSEKKVIFVRRHGKQITAFLSFHCRKSFQKEDVGSFEVFAHPDLKGKGNGSALIEFVEQYAKENTKLNRIEIGVLHNNPRAKKLYKKKGFTSLDKGKHTKGEWMEKVIKR